MDSARSRGTTPHMKAMRSDPFPPPGTPHIPTLPERLPLKFGERKRLETMVHRAMGCKLSDDELKIVCYLIRRAYGQGMNRGEK